MRKKKIVVETPKEKIDRVAIAVLAMLEAEGCGLRARTVIEGSEIKSEIVVVVKEAVVPT